MSPVFGHGRLRLYLLKLLAEEPRHGYDIIRALEDRFMGLYAPSAGTVYPRLARLAEEGLVSVTEEDGRKVYAITDAGREELAARSAELEDIEDDIAGSVRELADSIRTDVRGSARDLREELRAAAKDVRSEMRREAKASRDATRDAARESRRAGRYDEHLRRAAPTIDKVLETFRAESDVWSRAAVAAGAVSREAVSRIDQIVDDAVAEVRRVVAEARSEAAANGSRPDHGEPHSHVPPADPPAEDAAPEVERGA
jgi:DNA-binding PadR family transcriptional regulator